MNSPLTVELKDKKLQISVGINTLAKFLDTDRLGGYEIVNNEKFALDLIRQLLEEDDEGTTPVHLMLDEAANEAIDNGSEWVKEVE